jgi:hypothetical protein
MASAHRNDEEFFSDDEVKSSNLEHINPHIDFYEHGEPDEIIGSDILSKYIPLHERVGLVYDSRMEEHRSSNKHHPEHPTRVRAIFCALEDQGLAQRCVRIPAREATPNELLSVHAADYVQSMCSLHKLSAGELKRMASGMDSIYLCHGTTSAALLAAGSVLEATERVCNGIVRRAVCVVRPPGPSTPPALLSAPSNLRAPWMHAAQEEGGRRREGTPLSRRVRPAAKNSGQISGQKKRGQISDAGPPSAPCSRGLCRRQTRRRLCPGGLGSDAFAAF